MLKREVIDLKVMESLSPIFRGERGHKLAKTVMRAFAIDKVNWVYGRSCHMEGAAFADSLLKDLGVSYQIGNPDRLRLLPEGAFITVSNHPYGGIDGIMLIDLLADLRPDYKVMVNQFLSLIKAMDVNFISVRPKTGKKENDPSNSVNGIRRTLSNLRDGHPVGFFPAGAVSMFRFKDMKVRDREWQETIIRLVQMAKVPVLPIRFFDQNSPFFYFLGVINWRVRSLRMPREVFNKAKQRPRIGIGEFITPEKVASFKTLDELSRYVRKSVYDMPMPTDFIPRDQLNAYLSKA
ncbi:MAG: hemolysin [Bacteroidales bacterium]|nr:hemolysin [Bacteroidales bacterium]